MSQSKEFGCVYQRVKKGRRRKSFTYERRPAVKKDTAADGSVLLKPSVEVPVSRPADPTSITVTLAEGITVQLAVEPNSRPQEASPSRSKNGSAQCSKLIVGLSKQACVGSKFQP